MEKVCACDPPGETSAETKLPALCLESLPPALCTVFQNQGYLQA